MVTNILILIFTLLNICVFVSLVLFGIHLFIRHRSAVEKGINNIAVARKFLVEEVETIDFGLFNVVTDQACPLVYNAPEVKTALSKKLTKLKNKVDARVIIGPKLLTINGDNFILELFQQGLIYLRKLNSSPVQHFRICGSFVYIEEPHLPGAFVERKYIRFKNNIFALRKKRKEFETLWNSATPIHNLSEVEKEEMSPHEIQRFSYGTF